MYKIDHKLKIKSEDLIHSIHEYDVDPTSSHIYLFGREEFIAGSEPQGEPGVEYTMANRFIKNLNICMRANPETPIIIHMKTCGGDWAEGIAIYNAIRACTVPVTILCYTHARSMSSLIFLAANKRVLMPDTWFMFHDGTLSVEGTVKQVRAEMELERITTARMLDIYTAALKYQGKFKDLPEPKLRKKLKSLMDKKEDVYLTPQEALDWGFADEVFGEGKIGYDWSKLTEYTPAQLQR